MNTLKIILLFLSWIAIYTSIVTEVASKPAVSRNYFPRGFGFFKRRADSTRGFCMSRDTFECKPYKYRTMCISKRSVCDGRVDCPRGDDESCCACPTLSLENGRVRGNWKKVGSIARFTCNVGYTEVNSKTSSTCTWKGVWTYKPRCVIDCGNPPLVDNANVSPGPTLLGTTRTYICDYGNVAVPKGAHMSTKCQSNGIWSSTGFDCFVDCGHPPFVTNAIISEGPTLLHFNKTYTCKDGYQPNEESSTISCLTTGTWEETTFNCTIIRIIDCGLPPIVTYAIISEGPTTLQSSKTYTCEIGYLPNDGSSSISCLDSGYWESTAFNCTEVTLGEECDNVPCVGTGAFCSGYEGTGSGRCVCGPLDRYNATIGDCQQECTSIANEFNEYDGIFLSSPYKSEQQVQSDDCRSRCLDEMNCTAVIYYDIGAFKVCYFYTYSVEVGQSLNLVTENGDAVAYSRQCAN